MKISVVIPCYCSQDTLEVVTQEIISTVTNKGEDYEIVLVDDCSPDSTYKVIQQLCAKNTNIKGLHFTRNFGQHAALMAGLRQTTGDVVVCLDDDGQTPPGEMFKLINELDYHDVAIARYLQKKHGSMRNLGSWLNSKMATWLIHKPAEIDFMSYFACKRWVVEEIIKYNNPFPYVMGLILRTTRNLVNVDILHKERLSGQSGYSYRKLISLWMNGFTAFSIKPLRIATLMGILTALLGFCYFVYIIINKLINPLVPLGYSSMVAALLLIGGAILLVLGLIGEYVGRIYLCINNAPQYVINGTENLHKTAVVKAPLEDSSV